MATIRTCGVARDFKQANKRLWNFQDNRPTFRCDSWDVPHELNGISEPLLGPEQYGAPRPWLALPLGPRIKAGFDCDWIRSLGLPPPLIVLPPTIQLPPKQQRQSAVCANFGMVWVESQRKLVGLERFFEATKVMQNCTASGVGRDEIGLDAQRSVEESSASSNRPRL